MEEGGKMQTVLQTYGIGERTENVLFRPRHGFSHPMLLLMLLL